VTSRITVTEYTVTAWPEDRDPEPNGRYFDVHVRPTHVPGKWAVTKDGGHSILTLGGKWTMNLPRQFRQRHYRTLERALEDAAAAAELVTVNGSTISDIIEFEDRVRAKRALEEAAR
jgi:hypothetical protein